MYGLIAETGRCISNRFFYGEVMRVLVFAHVPPPFHGQSYMVSLMLQNLGPQSPTRDECIELFHLNTQLSSELGDIGTLRPGKLFLLARYILQAWWMRWKYSIDAFYYVAAPPAKRGALYRDWAVLSLVSFFFKIRIFHWHAAGLGEWTQEGLSQGFLRRIEARITQWLFQGHDLSCVVNEWGRREVQVFAPKHVAIVPNCSPDPCPDFVSSVLPERLHRIEQYSLGTEESPFYFQLLFFAHATRTKGLFDTIEAVALANAQLARDKKDWRAQLTVAGGFIESKEEVIFHERIQHDDLRLPDGSRAVIYAGFVEGGEKNLLLRESDALCFASFFPAESLPVSIIESLAFGMPVVLSRWRTLPDMVPPALAHLANPCDPPSLATAILEVVSERRFEAYRKHYLENYTLARHLECLHNAFLSVAFPEKDTGTDTA